MKKLFLLVVTVFVFGLSNSFAQRSEIDVVRLINGSVIKGTIIEMSPDKDLKIMTADGNLFVYSMSEVMDIKKEAAPQKQFKYVKSPYDNIGYENIEPRHYRSFRREPVLSCLMSIWIPGLGQMYNADYGKGLLLFGGCVGGVAIMASNIGRYHYDGDYYDQNRSNEGMIALGACMFIGCYIAAIVDAPISSVKYNRINGFSLWANTYLKVNPTLAMTKDRRSSTGVKMTLSF